MPLSLVRVDNRLIHGQVVEAWLPHVKAARVVVADDEAANSPLIKAAMGLAVQSSVEVEILPLAQVDFNRLDKASEKVLLLFREVAGVVSAKERGLPAGPVNLGNVHYGAGRQQVSPSVFLSQQELDQLRMLSESGMEVEVRAVPSDRAIHLAEMQERFGKGT